MPLTRVKPSALDRTLNYTANTFSANYITFGDGTTQTTAGVAVDAYARTQANTANTLAQGAFDKANTSGSGYLANSVIFANTTGYLSNTNTLRFYTSNNTLVTTSLTLTNGGGGQITFADGTTQTTAASGAATDQTARTTANLANTLAQGAYDRGNTANALAQTAFDKANTANTLAQGAYDRANTANTLAQGAYDKANTEIIGTAAFSKANVANTLAQSAFDKANTANTLAQTGFDKANTANTLAQGAYDRANVANTIAVSAYAAANTKLPLVGGTVTGNLIISTTGYIVIQNTQSSISNTSGTITISGAGGIGVGGSIYVGNRVGFSNSTSVSAAYQVYNQAVNGIDTVFG